MVNLTRIYTRTGDDGTTALGDLSRTRKTDPRLAAYADANEANAAIGVALAAGDLAEDVRAVLTRVQNDLFDIGADLATPLQRTYEYPPLRVKEEWVDYVVPQMHHRPKQAITQAQAACRDIPVEELTLIGSSLGGFYATVVAERLGCRAALLNPAVHPQRHFMRYLGPQRNLYTGEAFVLTADHVEELRALDPPAITRPERYWLFVETGDEVLDYREAVAYYAGALQEVTRGGDHSLVSFPERVPEIVEWARS